MWLRSDLDTAVAWTYERDLLCGGCGLPRDETMDKGRQFAYRAKPVRCHACKAAGDAARQFTSGPHDLSGVTWSIAPVDDHPT